MAPCLQVSQALARFVDDRGHGQRLSGRKVLVHLSQGHEAIDLLLHFVSSRIHHIHIAQPFRLQGITHLFTQNAQVGFDVPQVGLEVVRDGVGEI